MADFHGADLVVEIAFGYDPFDAAPVWTDVTADVRGLSFARGRQYELDRIDAGTARVTLSNLAGDYNPKNTAGTYYPDVKAMVPIRITATYNAVTYRQWYGFVERWPMTFPAQTDSLVTVECIDLFKLLALADASAANRTTAVEALSPVAWWRFGDTSDSAGADNTLTFSGSPTVGGAAGIWSGDEATTFDGTDDAATVANEADVEREGLDRSWEVWLKSTGSAITGPVFAVQRSNDSYLAGLIMGSSGLGIALLGNGGVSFVVGNGEWHHVVLTNDVGASTTVLIAYVDGVNAGTATIGNSLLTGTWTVRIGRHNTGLDFFDGDLSEIAVYPTALTSQEVASLYAARFENFATERTDERIAGLLANEDWTLTDLAAGQTTMSGLNSPEPSTVLEGIQTAADTEFGQFFMDGAGNAVFHDRHYRLNEQDTSNGIFGPANLPYVDIEVNFDDERIFNEVKVKPSDAADPFIANDPDSEDSYGRRTLERTIYPSDANVAYDAAHYLKALYSEPDVRVDRMSLVLGGDAALWPVVLGAELDDRFTVNVPLAGDDLAVDVHLEAISHTVTADKRWTVEWQLSPASTQSFWTLGVTNLSELDETTVLAY